MSEALTAQQMKWLEEAVARGRFSSVEDAVQIAVADLIGGLQSEDLDWARPMVDEARASIKRGEGLSAADVKSEVAGHLHRMARS